jgi:hypothetical protein
VFSLDLTKDPLTRRVQAKSYPIYAACDKRVNLFEGAQIDGNAQRQTGGATKPSHRVESLL